ncbi:helix-turn-helix transcriptional regulator [Citrobacter cronae]|uniref:helix-turn-helix transcriptional regulator n=1 Tax=Citrobacter cronae TaxID=1748967 RepID=UPI001C125A03|nr:helix-turn-helix transcriptional regulator [Citrobacter cronae]MBU5388983.1 helix-turn-helix transcriptional regulator [Citrobacter cronae]
MSFNKIRTHHGLFCYTENESIDIILGNTMLEIGKGTFFFLEKNLQIKVKNGIYPKVICLNDSAIKQIYISLLRTVDFPALRPPYVSPIHTRKANFEEALIFNRIDSKIDYIPECRHSIQMISIITYLLLQFESEIVKTIAGMVKPMIKDKVISIIKSDMSKQWTTGKVSDILCISEISLRKKLDLENEKFLEILTDLRMNEALKLLTTTEGSVEKISRDVGYCTTSYFIKVFKTYFGYTPKQISLREKNRVIRDYSMFSV